MMREGNVQIGNSGFLTACDGACHREWEKTNMLRTAFACTIGLFVIGSAGAQSTQGVPGDEKNFVT